MFRYYDYCGGATSPIVTGLCGNNENTRSNTEGVGDAPCWYGWRLCFCDYCYYCWYGFVLTLAMSFDVVLIWWILMFDKWLLWCVGGVVARRDVRVGGDDDGVHVLSLWGAVGGHISDSMRVGSNLTIYRGIVASERHVNALVVTLVFVAKRHFNRWWVLVLLPCMVRCESAHHEK